MFLRRRLTILFLSLGAIPIIFVGMLFFINAKNAIIRENLTKLESITKMKVNKLNDFFGSLRQEMTIMQNSYFIRLKLPTIIKFADERTNPEYSSAREVLDDHFRIWLEIKEEIIDMTLSDTRGRIVYSLNKEHQKQNLDKFLSDLDSEAFKEGKKSMYLGDISRDETRQSIFCMLLTAPVYDSERKFIGMVAFEINVDYLFTFLQEMLGLGKTAETVIGRKALSYPYQKIGGHYTTKTGDHVVFLNPLFNEQDAALKETVFLSEPKALPIQHAVSGESGSGVSIDYRGRKVLAAWRYIPSLKWGMVTKIDMDEAIIPINVLKKLIIVIILIVTVLTGLMGVAIANSIAKPLQILHEGAERIGEGNLNYKIGIDSPDEIGQLSRAIDEMTGNLQKTTASVDILNKEIESRKMIEKQLAQAKEKAEVANRAKSDFLSNMSHELRTPLNAVIGFSEILKDESFGPVNDKQREYITDIWTSGKHLLSLINEILDLSKVEAGKMELQFSNFDLGEVIESAVAMVKERALAHHIAIDIDIKDSISMLIADERKIKQVLFNLFSNAVKFTLDGGEIGIDVRKFDAGNVLVSVWDTGIGIETIDKDRIFREFEQIDSVFARKETGTGLGLALTKKLVELHGGKIWFESEGKNKGSRFSFLLPAYDSEKILYLTMANKIETAQKTNKELLIFVVHFKDYIEEEIQGEAEVERFIPRLIAVLKNMVRAEDCVMRKNKDKIILLQEINRKDYSEIVAKLKEAIKKIVYETEKNMHIDCSYGVARYPYDGNNAQELLEKAEKSLVTIKAERLKKRIMIVDDEPVIVNSLKKILLLEGYNNVFEAYDGEEALRKSMFEKIDLVILDLLMPKISGYEVIARLKEYAATKDVAIIIMSGSQEAIRQFEEGSSERAIPIINKPIDIKELRVVMSRLL